LYATAWNNDFLHLFGSGVLNLKKQHAKNEKGLQIKILEKYYKIKGDGVAEMNMDTARKSPAFKSSVRKLAQSKSRLMAK
jgi:hypothetical protein